MIAPVRWLLVGVAVLALASCSRSEAGTPAPADPEVAGYEGRSTGSSTTDGAAEALAELEPCELLSAEDVARLGVSDGQDADFGDSPGCDWTRSGDFGVTIGFSLETGVDDANLEGAAVSPISVGGHDGFRVEAQGGADGSCAVLLVVSDSSYVDVSATASGGSDTAKACDTAMEFAELVEPELP